MSRWFMVLRKSHLSLVLGSVLLSSLSSCGRQGAGLSSAQSSGPNPSNFVGSVSLDSNVNARLGYPSGSNSEIYISRRQYLLSWNEHTRDINWASWKLAPNNLGDTGRSGDFKSDD